MLPLFPVLSSTKEPVCLYSVAGDIWKQRYPWLSPFPIPKRHLCSMSKNFILGYQSYSKMIWGSVSYQRYDTNSNYVCPNSVSYCLNCSEQLNRRVLRVAIYKKPPFWKVKMKNKSFKTSYWINQSIPKLEADPWTVYFKGHSKEGRINILFHVLVGPLLEEISSHKLSWDTALSRIFNNKVLNVSHWSTSSAI